MKQILLLHTGGTIGTQAGDETRQLSAETANAAGAYLVEQFAKSSSACRADCHFVPAAFDAARTTLSESMTLTKLSEIVTFLRAQELSRYDGIIVLHGTDTLAYTAALFAFLFADLAIPMVLVSGNRPPKDPQSNAVANFTAAAELIGAGLAPNVYVTYRNVAGDGHTRLYLGSNLLQSVNFSEEFASADSKKVFDLNTTDQKAVLDACRGYAARRVRFPEVAKVRELSARALLVRPYTGLNYDVYAHAVTSYAGVVHGSYHSGTVSYPGLVVAQQALACRKNGDIAQAQQLEAEARREAASPYSIAYLASACDKAEIPLFVAPSFLGKEQYETMHAVDANTVAHLLHMSTESAYAKLIVALSCQMDTEALLAYMNTEIAAEFIETEKAVMP